MKVVEAYKEHKALYVSRFEWGVFIWRPLAWDEVGLYESLFQLAPRSKADLEEKIFRDCVIEHPLPEEEFDNWYAGTVTTVANQILKISSASSPYEFIERLETVRSFVNHNFMYQVYASIMRMFPSYKLEELIALPLDSILEKLAMVEGVTGEQIPLQVQEAEPVLGAPIDFEAENRRLRGPE